MDDETRKRILSMSRTAHDLTESSYRQDRSLPGDPGWGAKQRILLADMALHLLQTALREGELSEEALKRNLFAILSISDAFVGGHDLKSFADRLYEVPPSSPASAAG